MNSSESHLVPSPKDRIDPLWPKVIYNIPCACGIYRHFIETRLHEHQLCLKTDFPTHLKMTQQST